MPLTKDEYLDAEKFPLSTQVPPVSFNSQFLVDSMNYDDLVEMEENGEPMDDRQKAKQAELKAKLAEAPGDRSAKREEKQPVKAPAATAPKKLTFMAGRPNSDSDEDIEAFAQQVVDQVKKNQQPKAASPAPPG